MLSVDGDDAFLLADKTLDVQKYNDTHTDVTWETCTMRSWLNGYGASDNVCGKDYSSGNFLDYAFTAGEQSVIKTTNVVNEDNPDYGTEGGNSTSDRVYLLSVGEVTNPDYGFTTSTHSTETRKAVNTAYVAAGGEINSDWMNSAGSTAYWWLRSPGDFSSDASFVSNYGIVGTVGSNVISHGIAARPALHLNLSSTDVWSKAETFTCKPENFRVGNYSVEGSVPATGNHDFVAIEGDSENHKCSVCGIQGNHDFSKQPYQVDEDGKHYQKCKDCGAESTHEAHTLKTTTTKATLTANGKKETKCSVCGKVTKTETIYAAKTIKLSATKTNDDKVKTNGVSSTKRSKQKITTAKIKTVKASKVKKKTVTIKLNAKTDGGGKLTYKVYKYPKGMKKFIKVNKKGIVTFKKKAKKGTYKITVTAAASGKYKKTTKVISIKVK